MYQSSLCGCSRALSLYAFMTKLFGYRQEAGFLGAKGFEPFVDARRNGLVGRRKDLSSPVVTLKSGLSLLV